MTKIEMHKLERGNMKMLVSISINMTKTKTETKWKRNEHLFAPLGFILVSAANDMDCFFQKSGGIC